MRNFVQLLVYVHVPSKTTHMFGQRRRERIVSAIVDDILLLISPTVVRLRGNRYFPTSHGPTQRSWALFVFYNTSPKTIPTP